MLRARRAEPGVHQPPRLRAGADLPQLRLDLGLPPLLRAARAAPEGPAAALPSLRPPGAVPAACPQCGNQDLAPVGQGTQRVEAALAGAVRRGADAAHRPRQHAPARRLDRHARPDHAARGRHPGRHADPRQGPRLPAPQPGRRAERRCAALQRGRPRRRAAVRAAHAGRRARRARRHTRARC